MTVNIIERMQNMYSIDSRAGDESGGCSGLERRRSHKVEGPIGSKNGLVSLISECLQNIENGYESSDIEKRESSVGPRFQQPIEMEVLAMERTEGGRRTFVGRREVSGSL
jgi:hypothetical protein